jgi:hypothetical protein
LRFSADEYIVRDVLALGQLSFEARILFSGKIMTNDNRNPATRQFIAP